MFDWDKIVVDVDNNVVDLTAGEVALLIASDADTVTWGNITGDLAQQADLMLQLDDKISVDSPEFTGTPRTPTPPAGNDSTRIANTKFVNSALQAIFPINYATQITNKPSLGALASKNSVDYETNDVRNKPTLGAIASKDRIDYYQDIDNRPTIPPMPSSFGRLASKDYANWYTDISGKPYPSDIVPIRYGGTGVTTREQLGNLIAELLMPSELFFYVDGNGDDEQGDGSQENPFKTIQKAIDSASPFVDTRIYITRSTYIESLTITSKRIHLTCNPYISSGSNAVTISNIGTQSWTTITIDNGALYFTGNFNILSNSTGIKATNSLIYCHGSMSGNPPTPSANLNIVCYASSAETSTECIVLEDGSLMDIKWQNLGLERNGQTVSKGGGITLHNFSYAVVNYIICTNLSTLFYVKNGCNAYYIDITGSYTTLMFDSSDTPLIS